MIRRHSLLGCLVLLMPFCGCVAPQDWDPYEDAEYEDAGYEDENLDSRFDSSGGVLDYLGDRGLDLIDVASVRVAVGPGLLACARVTPWIAAGVGSIGRADWWATGFELKNYGVGWMRREGGVWIERRAELGISAFYYCESDYDVLGGNRFDFPPDCRGNFDVGAELHLALAGVAAEVRLDEALDFVVGIFGFDLLDDD